VMVDVNEDFTVDTDRIREAVTLKTKIIISVDIAGLTCDYERIKMLENEPEVKEKFVAESDNQSIVGRDLVLSDAAHSIGAKFQNKAAGNLTDITVFSFHAVKNITTAEGGAICISLPEPFDNEEEYRIMRLWTLNGQTKDAFTKSLGGRNNWKYDILFQGLKINMPDICAAIGLAQIKKYEAELLPERKRVADRYQSFFVDRKSVV